MKNLKIILLLICLLLAANTALAQSNPTIEIVLSQPTAKQGDIITADVYIRSAVNIGGADIGITVDDQCLRIIDRQAGSFLPSNTEGGSYSAFSELHDHDTRLAVAITDRSKLANGDGVFFQTHLEVICEQGNAPVNVIFAQFGAYKDPSAAEIELVAYTLSAQTVSTINSQLAISSQGGATAEPVQTLEATVTVIPTITPELTPVTAAVESTPEGGILLAIALGIMSLAVIGLITVLVVERRHRQRQD